MSGRDVHYGTRSWWDGTVTTLCGLKFGKKNHTKQMFTWGKDCPACKAAAKGKGK